MYFSYYFFKFSILFCILGRKKTKPVPNPNELDAELDAYNAERARKTSSENKEEEADLHSKESHDILKGMYSINYRILYSIGPILWYYRLYNLSNILTRAYINKEIVDVPDTNDNSDVHKED